MLSRGLVLTVLLTASGTASAAPRWEVEADPLAYIVNGFSAHVARNLGESRMRLQLGVFGADVPDWLHGEDDFDLRVRGVTMKVDYFLAERSRGLFIGMDADYSRLRYRLQETRVATQRNLLGVGPRAGYRLEIGQNLYATAWVSVRYLFNADDVTVSDKRFSQDRYAIFPAVHVGWRF